MRPRLAFSYSPLLWKSNIPGYLQSLSWFLNCPPHTNNKQLQNTFATIKCRNTSATSKNVDTNTPIYKEILPHRRPRQLGPITSCCPDRHMTAMTLGGKKRLPHNQTTKVRVFPEVLGDLQKHIINSRISGKLISNSKKLSSLICHFSNSCCPLNTFLCPQELDVFLCLTISRQT